MRPVRSNGDGVELEGQARGVEFWVEVAGLLRSLHRASDGANPFVHDCGYSVAHHTKAAVELKRGGGKEASTLEDSFFDEHQPVINQRPQTGHALWRGDSRERHFFDKNLARHLDRGELQFFLGAEMGEEAALAHSELLGEGADGKTFEALSGGDINRACKDSFAGAQAFGLAAKDGSVKGLAGAFFAGPGARSGQHENTVTHDIK